MLKLKLPTDPRWVNIAEKNLEEILTDHAFCEQKAASSAISFIVQYPEYTDLVDAMLALASEELDHLKMVHEIIKKKGLSLGRDRKDPYVSDLKKFFAKGSNRESVMIHRLMLAAMIEARSCERFKVLSENLTDPELCKFYHKLMVSEATHYTLFLGFAKKYGKKLMDVEKIWNNFLIYEASIIKGYGNKELIHG